MITSLSTHQLYERDLSDEMRAKKKTLGGVLKCMPELKSLSKVQSRKKRQEILKRSRKCIFYAISEIARNIAQGNIPVSEKDLAKLRIHRKKIRDLAKKTTRLRKRKAIIINQSSGFLPQLLIPAITVLGNIAIDQLLR